MNTRILCKPCGSIIQLTNDKDVIYCSCGKLHAFLEGKKIHVKASRDEYQLVDDEGHALVLKEDIEGGARQIIADEQISLEEALEQLLIGVKSQIEAYERYSPGQLFSPATNKDFLGLLVWVEATARLLSEQMKKNRSAP